MKCFLKVFIGVLTTLISVETAFAQTERGDKELSIAASFMARKIEHDDQFWTAFNIPIRLGFLVTQNIEVEPEILFSKYEEEDAGFILSGNLAYNFNPTSPESKSVPFVLGGLGFSNTIMLFAPNAAWVGDKDENWTVLNLGGGIKMFMSKPVALRLEYRFQKFLGDSDITYHNIFLGVSVFL
jgi:opacity protein-like surface antigen